MDLLTSQSVTVMAKQQPDKPDSMSIKTGKISASGGATVGIDRSNGKSISVAETASLATPAGFLLFALKQLPLLIWGVGVIAILALVALAALWRVPVGALITGGIGTFIGMFGLVVFASLVQPPPKGVKPPLVAKVMLWSFA